MIAFCVECGARQGWGHLVRSMAVADQVHALGGTTAFHVAGDTAQAAVLLGDRHPVAAAAPGLVPGLAGTGARAVLLDGYGFTEAEEGALAAGGFPVAVMDDFARNPHHFARLIVNGNLHYARPELYPQQQGARLLLGPAYAPLRAALSAHRAPARIARQQVARVLVVMGGSDAAGMLDEVMDALTACTGQEVTLVVAAAARAGGQRAWAAHAQRLEWVREPDALAREMSLCDLGVSAGGMTSYELAFMGVPAILLPVTPGQAPVSAELARLGCAVLPPTTSRPLAAALGAAVRQLANAPLTRQSMVDAGQAIFDGGGARRIAAALLELAPAPSTLH